MGIHVKALFHFFIQLISLSIWKYQTLHSVVVNDQNGLRYGFDMHGTYSLGEKTEL